jgi:hypothetical protein
MAKKMKTRTFRSIAGGSLALFSLIGAAQVTPAQSETQNGGDFSSNPAPEKLPTNVILVKGAWSSASDSSTPLPEGGSVNNNVYSNAYFGLRYVLPSDWTQGYTGPPPSDSGRYVLAQFHPADKTKSSARGSILVTAQDLFFALKPVTSAFELAQYSSENLAADYKLELPPTALQIANHAFVRFDYTSPIAELHWSVLTTEIRCHAVQFIFTSRDPKLVESLVQSMGTLEFSNLANANGGPDAPVCSKDYGTGENVLERENPILTERRYNAVPVRIIIDKEGKVKHIHFLSAFPDQAKAITDALWQWQFRPFVRDGKPVEVETGIMFGRAPRPIKAAPSQVSE